MHQTNIKRLFNHYEYWILDKTSYDNLKNLMCVMVCIDSFGKCFGLKKCSTIWMLNMRNWNYKELKEVMFQNKVNLARMLGWASEASLSRWTSYLNRRMNDVMLHRQNDIYFFLSLNHLFASTSTTTSSFLSFLHFNNAITYMQVIWWLKWKLSFIVNWYVKWLGGEFTVLNVRKLVFFVSSNFLSFPLKWKQV